MKCLFAALQVILLWFTHFELGLQSADSCSATDDRLIITEAGFKPYCVMPNTKKVVTKTNEVTLQFISNAQVDAQGFRAFYSAGMSALWYWFSDCSALMLGSLA